MSFRDGPPTRIYGYPAGNGKFLTDDAGRRIAKGRKVNCAKVKPWQRGGMLSSERCSYQFKHQGLWYACRGQGDGMLASCRIMKSPPRDVRGKNTSKWWDRLDLEGARRRRR